MPNSWTLAIPDKELRVAQVHIWQIDLAPSTDIAGLEILLSPDEAERMHKFKRPPLATRFLHAHAALRLILSSYCHIAANALCFGAGHNGKPYLTLPVPAPNFNLSHSADRALIAVSLQSHVGVDIEEKRVFHDLQSLVNRFFSSTENRQWQRLPRTLQQDAFFKGWTSKEAFIKALGGGLSIPLDSFSIDLLPGRPPGLVAVDTRLEDNHNWHFHNIDVGNDFAATLATSCEAAVIENFILDWASVHPEKSHSR